MRIESDPFSHVPSDSASVALKIDVDVIAKYAEVAGVLGVSIEQFVEQLLRLFGETDRAIVLSEITENAVYYDRPDAEIVAGRFNAFISRLELDEPLTSHPEARGIRWVVAMQERQQW